MTTIGSGKETNRFKWAVLALLFSLQTGASLIILSFGPLAPFLQQDLRINRAQIGLFTSAVYAGSNVFGVVCGWLIDRFGVRLFLLLGPGTVALFFIAVANTSMYGLALVLVFIGGLGYAAINPAAAKSLTYWFSTRARATAIGVMKSGVTIGGATGAALLPGLALLIGWRNGLTAVALAVIALGVLATTVYRESPGRESPGRESPGPAPPEAQSFGLKDLRQVVTNRSILLVGVVGMAFSSVQLSASTYLVLFLTEAVELPVVIAGTYLTVASLSGAAGRVLWGAISDRLFGGRRKTVLFIIGIINASMAFALAFLATSLPAPFLYAIMVIFGFSAFGFTAVYITLLAELVGKEQAATAVGLGLSINGIGIIIGPPLFGFIVDATNTYTYSWSMIGLIAAVGGILMLRTPEPK